MVTDNGDLQRMTMAELKREAHRVGIWNVEHMSTQELIEAIEQQRETNALQPEEPPPRDSWSEDTSMPRGWENFPG